MIYPVILSGGAGTRLWPVSRELHPKPFIKLADGESLLQKAYVRAAGLPGVGEVLTVTNRELYFKTDDEYRAMNTGCANSFILEPIGRNTAPAVIIAALHAAAAHGPETVLLVMPADHLIADREGFETAVAQAEKLAADGRIVTFGVTPTRAETGYGYIESEGNDVKRFVEKPSSEKAGEYVASGHYLWNAGIFCFRADAMIEAFEKYQPDILARAKSCYESSRKSLGQGFSHIELESKSFEQVQDLSIDYAIMEKSDRIAVVACDIGWSDIGSWSAISDTALPDVQGNRIVGKALIHDSTNCYIQSNDRIVGVVGVENLIIIDTPDAFLVANRNRTQDVKHIVGQLRERNDETYKIHREVHRPWGTYTVLEEGSRFKIKRIVVKPGAALSLQMHHHRSEHWIVVSGMAKVVNGERELMINTNESTYIPAGHKHRLENPGVVDLVMIEVQSGDYLGEDDIVRFQDVYGRS